MKTNIITQLVNLGWTVATERDDHICCVKKTVKTFRGEDIAHINPITYDEIYGMYHASATFITKGENALSLCHAYIKDGDNVNQLIKQFNDSVMTALSKAYSIKIAN
jgi:hypothetical protein